MCDLRFCSSAVESRCSVTASSTMAITLLILEVSVPEADFDNLWCVIADQWPSYLALSSRCWAVGR